MVTTQCGILATPAAALLRSWGRPSPLQGKRRKGSALPPAPIPQDAGRVPDRTGRAAAPLGLSPGLCGHGDGVAFLTDRTVGSDRGVAFGSIRRPDPMFLRTTERGRRSRRSGGCRAKRRPEFHQAPPDTLRLVRQLELAESDPQVSDLLPCLARCVAVPDHSVDGGAPFRPRCGPRKELRAFLEGTGCGSRASAGRLTLRTGRIWRPFFRRAVSRRTRHSSCAEGTHSRSPATPLLVSHSYRYSGTWFLPCSIC